MKDYIKFFKGVIFYEKIIWNGSSYDVRIKHDRVWRNNGRYYDIDAGYLKIQIKEINELLDNMSYERQKEALRVLEDMDSCVRHNDEYEDDEEA